MISNPVLETVGGVENKYVQWDHNILLNGIVLFSNETYV